MAVRLLSVIFLTALVNGASITRKEDIMSIATFLFTADHDITKLGVLFEETDPQYSTIFFIEADNNEKEDRAYYGLYVLKNGRTSKLLDNARDIVATDILQSTAAMYFAAKDGIYVYDKTTNSAVKYGSFKDEVISIAAENGTGVLYYLDKDKQLYKVTESGNKSTIVDAVKNAQEIVTDISGRLYYYAEGMFYVYDGITVQKIDIPGDFKKIWFVRPPVMIEDAVIVNGDDQYYAIFANGTSRFMGTLPNVKATAISADVGMIIYFAADKKIYELNIIEKLVNKIFEAMGESLRMWAENMAKLNSLS